MLHFVFMPRSHPDLALSVSGKWTGKCFVSNQTECFNVQDVAKELLLQTILSSYSVPQSFPHLSSDESDLFTPLAGSKSWIFATWQPAVQRKNLPTFKPCQCCQGSVMKVAMALFQVCFQLHFCSGSGSQLLSGVTKCVPNEQLINRYK